MTMAWIGTLGVAGRMWDAGVALLRYLAEHPGTVTGKRVVELGAGTGIVGLAVARLGAAHTVITDLDTVCPLIQQNCRLSGVEDRYEQQAVVLLRTRMAFCVCRIACLVRRPWAWCTHNNNNALVVV